MPDRLYPLGQPPPRLVGEGEPPPSDVTEYWAALQRAVEAAARAMRTRHLVLAVDHQKAPHHWNLLKEATTAMIGRELDLERARDNAQAEAAALRLEVQRLTEQRADLDVKLIRASDERDAFLCQLDVALEEKKEFQAGLSHAVFQRDELSLELKLAKAQRDDAQRQVNELLKKPVRMEPVIHELKTVPEPFAAIVSGHKTFEWRKNDRDFRVGDWLHLREWDGSAFTGRTVFATVTYVLAGRFGVPDGYAVLSLDRVLSVEPV